MAMDGVGDILEKLHGTFLDASSHQRQTLRAILHHNARVSYLRPYLRDYDAPVDAATFRRAVPLSSYDDYADYINKLADGILTDDRGQPLLSADPLVCFFYSSGTSSSSKPKLLPYFDSKGGRAASSLAHQASAAILRRTFPPRPAANMVLKFIYAGNVTQTKGGYKAMAASAFPLHNTTSYSSFLSASISPKEVILGTDMNQQLYCHLHCGLRHFDTICGVSMPYAAGLIKAFAFLESSWEKLCEDLEKGIPSSDITDTAMRQSLVTALGGPRPDLSKRVRSICEATPWDEGIVPKLWPLAGYIKCITTGSMVKYYSKLKHYAGGVPILGGDYFASECCVAINMDLSQPPELTRYVILPTAAYFEFLPVEKSKSHGRDEQETMDISSVEVGKMYEVVVTTFRGLYRLRLGDIVRVVGYHFTSPLIEFVMRAPKAPSEFITEKDLLSAMASFRHEVVEFASYMDMESEPKQLTIFVEIKDKRQCQ